MSLTDTAIKRLKPSDKCTPNRPDKISDGDGLELWVRHTGNKVWYVDYTYQGKRQEMAIGKYPSLTLAQARQKNLEIKSQLAQGINPKEAAKLAKQQKADNSFDVFAQKWLDHQQARIKAGTFKRDKGIYNNHVYPMIGEKDIYSLKLPDIMVIHDKLALAGKTSTARRVISTMVSSIFDFAIEKGLVENLANPIPRTIHKSLVPYKTKHYPRIKITELPQLLADIDSSNSEPLTKYGFYILCYTFVRTKELRGMTWDEVDFNTCLWHIPAERMKNDLPHVVPLAPQVMKILKDIKALGFCDKYVFASNRSRKNETLSSNAFTIALKRMGYKDKMTGHGFRGLASTSLYEMQYNPQAIELQLSHVQGSKTVRAYNKATLLPARTKMMNEWANIVDEIKGGIFDNYRNKMTASHDEMAFTDFMQRLGYKPQEVADELEIHRLEMMELVH